MASLAVGVSFSFRLLLIKSLLPLLLTAALFSASIFDPLIADIDDEEDLLLTIFPFDSSAFVELHLQLFAGGVDGDSDVDVVVVVSAVAVVGDGVAVISFGFVPIVGIFVNTLLSSDRIDCNVFPLLMLLLACRSHTSSDFDDFCEHKINEQD